MSTYSNKENRTQLKIVVRAQPTTQGTERRFQSELELYETVAGEELVERLAKYGYDSNITQASRALRTIEDFILKELAEGNRLDFGLASFYPRLSGALTARDMDPESDGLYVRGAVKARRKLESALKEKAVAINPLARKVIRIHNVFDSRIKKFDTVVRGDVLSVIGVGIPVDASRPDEGYFLEKRDGRWHRKPKSVARAEVLKSDFGMAEIVFKEPIAPGKYNLVVYTRGGNGPDYKVRHIGHPVTVIE